MDEAKAIARLKAGDISGLHPLVERYQVEAVQAAAFITGDQAAAEDVVQAAFLRAFEKIRGFDSDRPFRPWFLRMVVNDALKAAARQRRRFPLGDGETGDYPAVLARLEATPDEPEEALQRKELLEAMQKAIDRLSPTQRAAIVTHYFLGLSTAEAAGQLDCTPGTLRWRLSAARERLRVLLAAFK